MCPSLQMTNVSGTQFFAFESRVLLKLSWLAATQISPFAPLWEIINTSSDSSSLQCYPKTNFRAKPIIVNNLLIIYSRSSSMHLRIVSCLCAFVIALPLCQNEPDFLMRFSTLHHRHRIWTLRAKTDKSIYFVSITYLRSYPKHSRTVSWLAFVIASHTASKKFNNKLCAKSREAVYFVPRIYLRRLRGIFACFETFSFVIVRSHLRCRKQLIA